MAKRKRKITEKVLSDSMFKIETGIPAPVKVRNNPAFQKLQEVAERMKDGESVFISADIMTIGGVIRVRQEFNRTNSDRKIISRIIEKPIKGTRIWMKSY